MGTIRARHSSVAVLNDDDANWSDIVLQANNRHLRPAVWLRQNWMIGAILPAPYVTELATRTRQRARGATPEKSSHTL